MSAKPEDMNIPPQLQHIVRVTRDAAKIILSGVPDPITGQIPNQIGGSNEARSLVDLYYSMQEMRKRVFNKIGAIERGADSGGTHAAIDLVLKQAEQMESNVKMFLEVWASMHEMWPWFSAVHGIGPVLSAGILAHLDPGEKELPPTVGHWWRFAGLDPTQRWLNESEVKDLWNQYDGDVDMRTRILSTIIGRDPETVIRDATTDFKTGEVTSLTKTKAIKSLCRIPFNRPLKTLCWKIGDQMVKLGSREDALYAKFYRNRKATEIARNERGDRRDLAEKTLQAHPNHAQKAIYKTGKLPDGRVDLMARRATVKMFLSHLHELWWQKKYGAAPPKPFATAIQGHAHYVPPYYAHVLGL